MISAKVGAAFSKRSIVSGETCATNGPAASMISLASDWVIGSQPR
jgi:hypothetical protein